MRKDNKVVSSSTKSLKQGFTFQNYHVPSFGGLVIAFIKGLIKPLMAAKAAVYRNPAIQPIIKQIPWVPLGLIVLAGTVLLYKDLNFNINLSAPTSIGTSSAVPNPHSVNQPVNLQGAVPLFSDIQEEKNKQYIRKYSNLAIAEMNQYGVPASILLAQGLIESKAGESAAATLHNNHFAVKCYSKKCRKGHCGNLEDMGHKAFYRKYNQVNEGWRAHSLLVTTGKYRTLTQFRDFQSWANGLQQLEYNASPDYAKKLIQLVRHYELATLDN